METGFFLSGTQCPGQEAKGTNWNARNSIYTQEIPFWLLLLLCEGSQTEEQVTETGCRVSNLEIFKLHLDKATWSVWSYLEQMVRLESWNHRMVLLTMWSQWALAEHLYPTNGQCKISQTRRGVTLIGGYKCCSSLFSTLYPPPISTFRWETGAIALLKLYVKTVSVPPSNASTLPFKSLCKTYLMDDSLLHT